MNNHKHFLKLLDFTPAEIQQFLDTAADLKAKKKAGVPHRYLEGKNVALIFEKTSTRTRCAFEVAAQDLGMGSTYLGPTGSQIGVKESIADTARVLGRMYDGIEYRGFGQAIVEELAQYAGVPVFNGLTDEFHPTQILADFLTIQEHFGKLKGIKLVYLGDARFNMGNSLMVGCAKMGMHFVACAPKAYMPDQKLIDTCQAIAAETGAVLEFIEDSMAATKGADVLYTDVWVSMGEPVEVWQERIAALAPYQVTQALMDRFGVSQASADAREAGGVRISEKQMISGVKEFYANSGDGMGMLSRYVYDMTNVRLRELTLGYDLPSSWFNDKLRATVSLVGRNLFMFYNKAPFDPEVTASTSTYYQNLDFFMQPSVRTIGFSVRLQF